MGTNDRAWSRVAVAERGEPTVITECGNSPCFSTASHPVPDGLFVVWIF